MNYSLKENGLNIRKNDGLSLIELTVGISILTIILIVGIPKYKKMRVTSIQAQGKAMLQTVNKLNHVYFMTSGKYITVEKEIVDLGLKISDQQKYTIEISGATPGYEGYTAIVESKDKLADCAVHNDEWKSDAVSTPKNTKDGLEGCNQFFL